ncbi:hypothetical protein LGG58_004592 [Escherichia coli]|nr:hypothetical protein [Escherichia coli]EIH1038713.1 hypothetical protein [Escherichia coli]
MKKEISRNPSFTPSPKLRAHLNSHSYRVKFPGVAEIVDEHPPKRQQQAAAAKAPEITPFTS